MTAPSLAVAAAAESFWSEAGVEPAFPRAIRRAVARSQPISVVTLSVLHVAKAEGWLRRQGIAINIDVVNRPLRACLVAHAGAGIIFVDGADTEDEQRFSIAHELAHFLVDYLAPRRAAVARLGEDILDVLDGARPARTDERVVGLLANVTVGPHVHLMGRCGDLGRPEEIERAESMADALARELLAPWDVVTRQTAHLAIAGDVPAITRLLVERFGLPTIPAKQYAARLGPEPAQASAFMRHLRRVELSESGRNIS
jgi:hypothetical protein